MAKTTRATAALDKAGIAHGLHAYDYAAEVESKGVAAAQALGIAPAQVFKTLMAWVDKQPVVAVIPSDQRLSLKKLAAACNGKHAQMMDVAEAEKRSGYKVGGISPLAQKKLLPTVLDESAMQFDEILVSGGKRGLSVGVAPADMVRLMNWIAAPIGDHHD